MSQTGDGISAGLGAFQPPKPVARSNGKKGPVKAHGDAEALLMLAGTGPSSSGEKKSASSAAGASLPPVPPPQELTRSNSNTKPVNVNGKRGRGASKPSPSPRETSIFSMERTESNGTLDSYGSDQDLSDDDGGSPGGSRVLDRKERNRLSAKRSRQRRKEEAEVLREELGRAHDRMRDLQFALVKREKSIEHLVVQKKELTTTLKYLKDQNSKLMTIVERHFADQWPVDGDSQPPTKKQKTAAEPKKDAADTSA
eukprot:GFYU01000519.1.p1 GENE.GFYU01000519.1~~GFYU01000519.1.p1  ORF type:complete len:255 (-),score=32.53 GFYU01000519.1:280-1044(-)